MSGFMNSYFYGKAGQADYTVDQLPTTRTQLFFTVLKVRFSSMIGLNLMVFAFMLPALIWTGMSYFLLLNCVSEDGYKLGSAEMQAAYFEMAQARDDYDDIINAEKNIAQLEYDISEIDAQLASIAAGETVYKTVEVISGSGETEQVALTSAELEDSRLALEEKLAAARTLSAMTNDEKEAARQVYLEKNSAYSRHVSNMIKSQITTFLIILAPLMAIGGIGSCGQMYVLRKWSQDEHAFMWSDFWHSVKTNWKQGLIVGLLNGLSLLFAYVCYFFYGEMASSSGNMFWSVPQMMMIVLLVIWWMLNMLIFPMMVTYNYKLGQLIKNSALMAIARLPFSVLFLVGSLIVPVGVMLFVPNPIISFLVLALIYMLFGYSLTGFVFASYANSCFDKYLNARIEGAPLNKGLHKPEDEEDEEENALPSLDDAKPKEDRFWERKSK